MAKVDTLFEYFAGEYVVVMVNRDMEQTVQTDTKVETTKIPISFGGYLLDIDENFLYMGEIPDAVSSCIKRAEVIHIEISSEEEDIPTISMTEKEKQNLN